jgi:hypothetical protein
MDLKKIGVMLFLSSFVSLGFSQNKFEFKDRLVLDLFHSNWLNHNENLKTKWYSRGIGLSYNVPFTIVKDRIILSAGGGFNNYNLYTNSYFSNSVHPDTTLTDQTYTKSTVYADNAKPSANKLTLTYLDIPVELHFLGKKDKRGQQWKLTLGGQAGYKVDIHARMKNSTGKYKDFIFPNAEKWRYGLHFRVGYGRTQLYGFYSLNTVFRENYGEYLRPVALGFSYTLY